MTASARTYALLACAAAMLMATTACDPCSGVATCRSGSATMRVGGFIVNHKTGAGVANVGVQFTRTSGVGLSGTTVSTTTDASGRFDLSAGAAASGNVIGDLTVNAPGGSAYTVHGVNGLASTLRGDGTELDPMTSQPYIAFTGVMHDRNTGKGAIKPTVSFTRTGGVSITPSTVSTQADSTGTFSLTPTPAADGQVIGTLTITGAELTAPYQIQGVAIPTLHELSFPPLGGFWNVGPSLDYTGQLLRRGSDAAMPNVGVNFTQSGGIAVTAATFTAKSDSVGRFLFNTKPLATGTLVGRLIFTPASPLKADTVTGVQVPTFNSDSEELLGVWRVGPQVAYAVEVFFTNSGALASGVTVTFTRTSGVTMTPSVLTGVTNSVGRASLIGPADAMGDVVGTLQITPPAPYAAVTMQNVHLTSFESDQLVFFGRYGVSPALTP